MTKREINLNAKLFPPQKTKHGGEIPFSLTTKRQAYELLDEIRENNVRRMVLLFQSAEQKRYLETVLLGAPARGKKWEKPEPPELDVYHMDTEWYEYQPANEDEECLLPINVKAAGDDYRVEILSHRASTIKAETWEWVVPGYLPKGAEVHLFAGKGRGKTKVCNYFNKLANDQGLRVIRFNMEDHEASIFKPTMYAAGCNLELTEVVDRAAMASKDGHQSSTSGTFRSLSTLPRWKSSLRSLVMWGW